MGEFQEKFKVNIGIFNPVGSTSEEISPYFDMRGYRRIDAILEGFACPSTGGPSTLAQGFTMRLIQATDSTGGGATGISSATAGPTFPLGKDGTAAISAAANCREGLLRFSTLQADTGITITIGTALYKSGTSGSAANVFACSASNAATVAAAGFVAMFNSTVNNTATAITENWVADRHPALPIVRIRPKAEGSTLRINIGTTGCSQISVGEIAVAHIGVDAQFMKDGHRYVAVGVKSTADPLPYTVTVIREKFDSPVVQEWNYSKTLSGSTSK